MQEISRTSTAISTKREYRESISNLVLEVIEETYIVNLNAYCQLQISDKFGPDQRK